MPIAYRLLALALLLLLGSPVLPGADLSDAIAVHGNKAAEGGAKGRARNVWDLQRYAGKIFQGTGSTVDNPGPQPVWAFDPATGSYDARPEAVIPQEAVELFRVLDGDLYIPAADPVGTRDESKFHRRSPDGTWTHYLSTGLRTAHIRDLALRDGMVIGVGNSRDLKNDTGAVAVPLESVRAVSGGDRRLADFRSALDIGDADQQRANWFFALFEAHGELYASTFHLGRTPSPVAGAGEVPHLPTVVRWDDETGALVANQQAMIPAPPEPLPPWTLLRPFKPLSVEGVLVAPMRSYALTKQEGRYHKRYNQSVGLVVKGKADEPARWVQLPGGAVGEDVLVVDGVVHVLANQRLSGGGYRISVFRTRQPSPEVEAWEVAFHLRSENLGRSFEHAAGRFYIGLGFATGDPVADAGRLISVKP